MKNEKKIDTPRYSAAYDLGKPLQRQSSRKNCLRSKEELTFSSPHKEKN